MTKKVKEKIASNQPNNNPYLIAVISMVVIAIVGVIAITWLRPESDILIIGAMVFGFIAPTTLSLLTFMKSQETHLSVNSRLEDFIKNSAEAARGQGLVEGAEKANRRTDALAEKGKTKDKKKISNKS